MSTNTKHEDITIERLNNLLDQVGKLDGINGLTLNAEGTASLRFSGGKEVFFEYCRDSGIFFIYTQVFSLPWDPARRATLMQGLLSSNFLRMQSGAGEYAIDRTNNIVIYQIGIDPAILTVEKLDRYIDTLLNHDSRMGDFIHTSSRISPLTHGHGGGAGHALQRRLLSRSPT